MRGVMTKAPILQTTRLQLVPFSEQHLTARYIGWLNDPEVVRYSELRHHAHTTQSCREYLRAFRESPHYFWAIETRSTEPGHIGTITAHVDVPNQVADVGILIGEKAIWGNGYGTEAWRAVCAWLLEVDKLRKVTAGAMASNKGMRAIMQRVGMSEEGSRRQHFILDGHPQDLVYCALFRMIRS